MEQFSLNLFSQVHSCNEMAAMITLLWSPGDRCHHSLGLPVKMIVNWLMVSEVGNYFKLGILFWLTLSLPADGSEYRSQVVALNSWSRNLTNRNDLE